MGVVFLFIGTHKVKLYSMAELVRNRSSGRQRLRQGYVGKNFTLEGRQYVVDDVIAEGELWRLCIL